jgi:hypothetical protein
MAASAERLTPANHKAEEARQHMRKSIFSLVRRDCGRLYAFGQPHARAAVGVSALFKTRTKAAAMFGRFSLGSGSLPPGARQRRSATGPCRRASIAVDIAEEIGLKDGGMGVVVHSLRDGDCLGVGERRRCIKEDDVIRIPAPTTFHKSPWTVRTAKTGTTNICIANLIYMADAAARERGHRCRRRVPIDALKIAGELARPESRRIRRYNEPVSWDFSQGDIGHKPQGLPAADRMERSFSRAALGVTVDDLWETLRSRCRRPFFSPGAGSQAYDRRHNSSPQERRRAPHKGFVVEPAIPGNDDVMTVVLGAESNTLRFDLEAVPPEQVARRGLTDLVSKLLKVHSVTVTSACRFGGC